MKRVLFFVLLLVAAGLAAVYFFIPKQLAVKRVQLIHANENAVNKFIHSKAGLLKWWGAAAGDTALRSGNFDFAISAQAYRGITLDIKNDGQSFPSTLDMIPLGRDSVQIIWSTAVATGNNPIQKIGRYNRAKNLSENMDALLGRLKAFTENTSHTYGITVEKTKVKDTVLLTLMHNFKAMPTDSEVYAMINQLKAHIKTTDAKEMNAPMLNINTEVPGIFETMVAISINKEIAETADMKIKRMFAGKILIAECKGGHATIAGAFKGFEEYKNDYEYTSPAKPFQSLVTNRLEEKDTAKWVTKIYYPVF
jgi:DNA gyrase inhibitor GyrI